MFKCDSIIVAISQAPRTNIVSSSRDLSTDKYGLVVTDEKGITTLNGVFASGDVVSGPKTVVEAVANSKKVAHAIDYLKAPKSYNLGERVVVIGAGNVAMDAARTAKSCLLYTSPSPRDRTRSRMPSSA